MRISEDEQEKTRIRILEAGVDIITEKGFKSATMREIAKRAQIGDATIYNYFPTKEKLLYAYCAEAQKRVITELKTIPDFHTLSLREQLQQLAETELSTWLPAREFLLEVFRITFYTPISSNSHLAETRKLLDSIIIDLIDAAIEAGEIPDQPFRELLPRLFFDYLTGIFAYWLNDDSDNFENTTQLIDQTTAIIADILATAIIGKFIDVGLFLYRTHVVSRFSELTNATQNLRKIKRRFMEGANTDGTDSNE